jgi:signal transduction histidine kinase
MTTLKERESIDTDLSREVSCRVINSLLKYLESEGIDTQPLFEGLPYSEVYLKDTLNWVPIEVRETIIQRAANIINDSSIMFKVGMSTPKLKSLSGLEKMILLLGNPKLAYKSVPKYAKLFDKIYIFKVQVEGDNKAIMSMSVPKGYAVYKSACYYAQGILAAIPTLWGLPPAEIHEKYCMCNAQGEKYTSESCEYEVTWQSQSPRFSLNDNKIFNFEFVRRRSVREIENNFQLLDEKNSELRLRNTQLAKVREIALAIDKVNTSAKVFETICELSRDIPGVRFVIVLQSDASGQNVKAPYYSKIRNQGISRTLKAVGFDFTTVFGDRPDSSIFKFQRSASNVAQEYQSKPQIMMKKSLAELLEGIWPKPICDTIQKVISVSSTVIVPVHGDTDRHCSILFLLNEKVPQDILEMVAAHCSAALKNASVMQTLEQRNQELAALNTIASQTFRSLDLDLILSSSIYETVQIFGARAGSIYILDQTKQFLKLSAQSGMPEQMVKRFGILTLGSSMLGKLIAGEKEIITGDLRDYRQDYPDQVSNSVDEISSNFVSIVLHSKGVRSGILTVVRTGKQFTNNELILFQSIANQVSIAIENAKLHQDALQRMTESEIAKKELENALSKLRAQKKLIDRILASTPNAVLVVNKKGQIILSNPAFGRLFNSDGSPEIGHNIQEFKGLDPWTPLIEEILENNSSYKQFEFNSRINDIEKSLIADVIPMEEEEILVILTDVTETRERQGKLYLTDRLASVGEMAAGIAHELNNPLTSITMLSQMLVKENMPTEDKEDLKTIQAEAKRAAAIVKNLLTFARKHTPERQPAQINRVLEDVLKLRNYEHKVNNIEVEACLDENLPDVKIDYFQMQQVFLNLVLNAEQAMIESHHQGRLTVTTERVNGSVKASVKDDGPGISEEVRKKLFTPFFTTKEVGKGTGLGLSISYGIVTNHGGKIYAQSEPGKGATFVVELPVNGN